MGVIDHETRLMRAFMRLRLYAHYAVGRIAGMATNNNGAFKQFRELDECRHYQRCELNALTALLVEKGLVTLPDLQRRIADEADIYERELHRLWPEVTPAEDGTAYSVDVVRFKARAEREGWPQ
jgi:hypothetical protein